MKKKKRPHYYPVFMFIIAQSAWFIIVGLWIYRYITMNIDDKNDISFFIMSERFNVLVLVGGLVLLVAVSVGMSLIFRHLTVQLNITNMYDNFIANVTHELKSPLSSIQLSLETLGMRDVPEKQQKEFIQMMLRDTDRLQESINGILNIARLEQNQFVDQFHVVNSNDIFRKMIHETAEQFKIPDEFITLVEKGSCQCVIDENAMRIVMNNLMDNAIKYSLDMPRIHIKLAVYSKYFRLRFSDSGIGIDKKDQKEIFKKFFRIYGRNIPNVKGTGLGLHLVREIIKAHGGRIFVQSEGRGKGSSFIIELPIYKNVKKRFINRLLKITQKRKKY